MKKTLQIGGLLLLIITICFLWYKSSSLFREIANPGIESNPTSLLDEYSASVTVPDNWLTYQGEFYTFKYPAGLEAFEAYENIWFVRRGEAEKEKECLEKRLGTMEKPCLQSRVFSLSVGIQASKYDYALRRRLFEDTFSMLHHFDDQPNLRTWQFIEPIEAEAALNLEAQLVGTENLYTVGIQGDSLGYQAFYGYELTGDAFIEFSKKLLSSFTFDETETHPYFSKIECTGEKITDQDVGFSMVCPKGMTWYVTRDHYDPYLDTQTKIINVCANGIDDKLSNTWRCAGAGISIWANGEGWGGGCDPEHKGTVTINSENKTVCMFETGISQLYVGDDTDPNRFNITASFSPTLTKDTVLSMFESFKLE